MSNAFYPLGNIASLEVELMDHTIVDNFEDGSSSSRRLWADKNFKRRFKVRHAPLSTDEFRYLRSFFTARSGRYDSFWFRDNVHRGGNASVRLAKPFQIKKSGSNVYDVDLELEETAPSRLLPDIDDLYSTMGPAAYVLWYDFNRAMAYYHAGLYHFDATIKDQVGSVYFNGELEFQSSNILYLTGLTTSQYQGIAPTGSTWLKSKGTYSLSTGTDYCVFAIVKTPAVSTKQVLFSVGEMGAGKAIGLALNASNQYEPWLGGSETWTGAQFANSPASTWRSIAVATAGNNVSLYVNAALVGTVTNTRNNATAPVASLLAAPDGSLIMDGNSLTNNGVNHAIFAANTITLTQIKALHNLFAYQYGLATVA